MRFVRTLISLGFVLFGVLALAVVVSAYLTATGRSVPAIRGAAARVGRLTAGQSTAQLAVSVVVDPGNRRLEGVARLRVKASDSERQRIYLLLNDGLRVREIWRESQGGGRRALAHYRFWLVTVVDLGEPIPAQSEVTIGISYGGDPLSGATPFGQAVFESDEIILTPADLWYPADLKSFFRADVEVTLPVRLHLVHSGTAQVVTDLGSSRRTRWTTARLVPGVALVAGRFRGAATDDAGVVHHAFVGEGIDLDSDRLLDSMVAAFADLGATYGASGASRQTVFVSRRLRRSFADGSGIVGLTPAEFRNGDYGFAAIADGLARTWWGGTVAAQPTDPEAGGAWFVEGFAANAARESMRKRFGADADFRWRMGWMYDPTTAGVLAELSPLEGELEPASYETSAGKAAYVAMMLQERVGGDAYHGAARQLLDRYRNQVVRASDLEDVFATVSDTDLTPFFEQWVHGIGQVDLSLDPKSGGAILANRNSVTIAAATDLWRVPPGGQPVEEKLALGAQTPLGNAARLVVDPHGLIADMYRSNNVLPREAGPRSIARSRRGSWMIVDGEPHDWAPARIREIDAAGQTKHVWDFDQGLLGTPRWSADGTRVLAVEPPRGGSATLYALHPSDGSQRSIGHDTVVDGGTTGFVAARKNRLILVREDGTSEIAVVDGGAVFSPRLSADDARVAYVVDLGAHMELRVVEVESGADKLLMTWPSGPVRWEWSPDGSRLFAVLAGDWDWQLWEIPLSGAPRALVREAAGVRSLAVSPDGKRVALVAQAVLDYSYQRYEVFVVDRADPAAGRHFTASGYSVVDASWRDDDSLFVVLSDPTYAMVPARRDVRILRLADGSVLDLP